VAWVEIFVVFVVCHLLGDYLLQTDWQAMNKRGGIGGDPVARRALLSHVSTYTLSFVPAGIWLADEMNALGLLALAVAIFVPHFVQDDMRLLQFYVARVKGCGAASAKAVFTSVDQSVHLIVLFLTALVVHGATT